MKKIFITIVLLFSTQLIFAQKIERAINALNENKTDKAIELFQELIEKNNSDLAAIIGLIKARDIKSPNRINQEELTESIDLITRTAPEYDNLSSEAKFFYATKLNINDRNDINYIIRILVEDLWINFISKLESIEIIESFESKYNKFYTIKYNVNERLLDLYYKEAELKNTLQDYQKFLYKFPKSKYTNKVNIEIDNLTFKAAVDANSIYDLEVFIKINPQSKNINEASSILSDLYIKSLGNLDQQNQMESILVKFNNIKKTPTTQSNIAKIETALSRIYLNDIEKSTSLTEVENLKQNLSKLLMADSISTKIITANKKIYQLELEIISTQKNHLVINEFLSKYENLNSNHLSLYDRRDSVWFVNLGTYKNNKLEEYADFFKTVTYNARYASLIENIRLDWLQQIRNTITSSIDNYIAEENSELSRINNLSKIILSNNAILKINLDPGYVLKYMSNGDIYNYLNNTIQHLLEEDKISANTLFYDYNSYSSIFKTYTLINGNIAANVYALRNNNLFQVPSFSINHTLFSAIKTRYGIVKFSNINIEEYYPSTDEYKISLYGYTVMNLKGGTCCPSFKIDILYTKQGSVYLPKTALSVNNNYSSIETSVNLNTLNKIDLLQTIGELNQAKASDNENYDLISETRNTKVLNEDEDYDKLFTAVQIQAEFPGGQGGWVRYLERTLNRDLPLENGAPTGKYSVVVSFIVSKDGTISEVKAENDPGYGTKEESIRVIERGPKWKPAVQNGRNVIYRQRQAIVFMVSEV
jgi:hypothetical protein